MSGFTPTPEGTFSFGPWTVRYGGRDPFGDPLEDAQLPELAVPTLAEGETWGDLETAATPDVEALGVRGMAFERLDQLALEHLYGLRP